MKRSHSSRSIIQNLFRVRNSFGPSASAEKLELLGLLCGVRLRTAREVLAYHRVLCFLRAYPDSLKLCALVSKELNGFHQRVSRLGKGERSRLLDSGIAGSDILYAYSFESAGWLVQHEGRRALIEWEAFEKSEELFSLLQTVVLQAEEQPFIEEEGIVENDLTTRVWFDIGVQRSGGDELAWLIKNLSPGNRNTSLVSTAYFNMELPLRWQLGDSSASITKNTAPNDSPVLRDSPLRRGGALKQELQRPFNRVKLLGPRQAQRYINLSQAALLSRQREVYGLKFGNPDEVYLADLGCGTELLLIGILPERRFAFEGNYTFVLLSNGVPVGYGGVTPLFSQINTGLNVFDEYRGGEAAFLFVQMLRVFRTLFRCSHIFINPYQIGVDNEEALQSGAFWFYYRLGFRPPDRALARLAAKEFVKLSNTRRHRTSRKILERLSTKGLLFSLHSTRQVPIFPEKLLGDLSLAVSRLLASQDKLLRVEALKELARRVAAKQPKLRRFQKRSGGGRNLSSRYFPFIALVSESDGVKQRELAEIAELAELKYSLRELAYIRNVAKLRGFQLALKKCATQGPKKGRLRR